MSAAVIYLPEAHADLGAAYATYEHQAAGLGRRFLNEVLRQAARISANPELYAVVSGAVRAAALHRFRYVIYYRVEAGRVYILAVLHSSRDPQEWLRRA